jgi:hypothetical protein
MLALSYTDKNQDDGNGGENASKKPKLSQPPIITTSTGISDAVRELLDDYLPPSLREDPILISKLQTLSGKVSISY